MSDHHQSDPHPPAPRAPRVSRRALLGGVVGLAAVGSVGAYGLHRLTSSEDGSGYNDDGPHASCADPNALPKLSALGAATLVYEVDDKARAMQFDKGFAAQLGVWLKDWNATSRYRGVTEIDSYGAYVPKDDCRSWHAAGRAFDIARLKAGDTELVNCRTDQWSGLSSEQLAVRTRRYWTLAASLHLHFAYVLTHYFDDLHKNHIHVDNGVSGSAMSTFDLESRVQNQAVEAICSSIWGVPGEVTGTWDSAKQRVAPVLKQLGVSDLTSQKTWQAFLRASVKKG